MKSNTEWIFWGKADPLYGVATWSGREKGGTQAWTDDAFYETGVSDWQEIYARWTSYGLSPSSCVEIGCGTGRLTKALAGSFRQVQALDVSSDMIAYARDRISAPNVTFHLTDGRTIPLEPGSVTSAFSTHVFQHFDRPEDGIPYFQELSRVLACGGSLMIHLPLHVFPLRPLRFGGVYRGLYAAVMSAARLGAAWRRWQLHRGRAVRLMRGISYDVHWLREVLTRYGFDDIEIVMFRVQSNGNFLSFVLARKLC